VYIICVYHIMCVPEVYLVYVFRTLVDRVSDMFALVTAVQCCGRYCCYSSVRMFLGY
jgi:hypothetical protein